MPALSPKFLNCTIYMYPTEQAAEEGVAAGGSGFLLAVPAPEPYRHVSYKYVVTNAHVIDHGNAVIRMNRQNDTDIVITSPEAWTIAVDDDLAVIPFISQPGNMGVPIVMDDLFLEEDCEIQGWPLFPGDEVLLIGRFVSHDGKQRNKPVVRFGNISMLPDADALVRAHGGRDQLAFLVECRSLSGFSGSPAFVHLTQPRILADEKNVGLIPPKFKFLGVDCAHFPMWSQARTRPSETAPKIPETFVETNSGIAVIIPAWRLKALINTEDLVKHREEALQTFIERQKTEQAAISDHAAATVDPEFTKEEFESALKKVSRKLSDEEKS